MDWYSSLVVDTDPNVSSKDFVAQEDWQLLCVRVYFTTTATVGDRLLSLQIYNSSDATYLLNEVRVGVVQAASTDWSYYLAPGLTRSAAAYDTDYVSCPIPNLIIRKTQMLRILDHAAVATDSDSMEVFITGMQKQSLWGGQMA